MSEITKYLYILLISMLPVIELRGAIPVGAGMGLSLIPCCIVSVIANLIPVPFIYILARRVLTWGSTKKIIGGFCRFCLNKGETAGQKLSGKTGTGLFLALMFFVGVPLPGTGAWTGTMAAAFLDIPFKKAFPAIMCGVIIAGTIVGLICGGVLAGLEFLL